MALTPTEQQFKALVSSDSDEPVVMLNLVRFKDAADGIDDGVRGVDAYRRYGEAVAPFLERVGGRILFAVEAKQMVIGPEELEWDMAILVEYPSVKRFLEMATDADYLAVHEHRQAALADSRLIACQAISVLDSPRAPGG